MSLILWILKIFSLCCATIFASINLVIVNCRAIHTNKMANRMIFQRTHSVLMTMFSLLVLVHEALFTWGEDFIPGYHDHSQDESIMYSNWALCNFVCDILVFVSLCNKMKYLLALHYCYVIHLFHALITVVGILLTDIPYKEIPVPIGIAIFSAVILYVSPSLMDLNVQKLDSSMMQKFLMTDQLYSDSTEESKENQV
jgi:hypothetical protein